MKNRKLWQRLVPFAMIAVLLTCALPALPIRAEAKGTAAKTEEELRSLLEDKCSNIILENDLELSKCLVLDYAVTLDLNGKKLYRNLSARQDDGHVIEVKGNQPLTVQNGTVSGGYAKYGGGILNNGNLVLKKVTVTGNKAFDGGGVLNHDVINISGCTLKDNCSKNGGGNLWSDGDMAILNNSTVLNGSAQNGGGIANHGEMKLNGCTVTGNTATNKGGGIFNNGYIEDAMLRLIGNNTIQNNTAFSEGGGVYVAPEGIGSICIRGKPVIKDNKKGEAKSKSNIYLCG